MEKIISKSKLDQDINRLFAQSNKTYYKSIALAYLALCGKEKEVDVAKYENIVQLCDCIENEAIHNFVETMLSNLKVDDIVEIFEYSAEMLKGYIINTEFWCRVGSEGEPTTPQCLCDLANRLLNIQESEDVLDNCMGIGSFLLLASKTNDKANFYGIDLFEHCKVIVDIKSTILDQNISTRQGNLFEEQFDGKLFDKVFSNYPFGIKIGGIGAEKDLFDEMSSICPDLKMCLSADWLYSYRLCQMLKCTGTGVALMTLGDLYNTKDRSIREYFVREGKIKAIIKLPSNLLRDTAIPVAMVIFGQNSNAIRMVDATHECIVGRRQNTLSSENIDNIINWLEMDSANAKSVSIDEIEKNQFNLNPSIYLQKPLVIDNGVKFGSVIKNITRGAVLKAEELDDMVSREPTPFQYMLLSNVKTGVVDKDLPYLKDIPKCLEKYCINQCDLLLSKNGYPFKNAVAKVNGDQKILANGNFYVITLDTEKVDPYYIKAFLDSELGAEELNSMSLGTSIKIISLSQLKQIIIPLIPLEEQKKIGLKCQAVLDEIEVLREKIEKAEHALSELYNNEMDNSFD